MDDEGGVEVGVVSGGDGLLHRRKAVGAHSYHDFFDHDNEENIRIRQQCAQEAMSDLKKWMMSDKRVSGCNIPCLKRKKKDSYTYSW